MNRRILLVRHGRTAWNAEGRYQGQADPSLDDVGRVQARILASLVAALRPDVILSSDLRRAQETAAPIAEICGLHVLADARLRERSLGHWEGLTRAEVAERYPDEYADWAAGRDVTRRGGETREQVASRSRAAFDDLPDVDLAVLMTHSATAMALCAELLGLSQQVHVISPLANCHWSELRSAEGEADRGVDGAALGWRLRSHNVGAPGIVIPFGMADRAVDADDAADAQA
ncbi:MAG TPA: histidine phosphatase family protein [Jatrophihabitantaceae bacterium]|nr:histidine phosphatase family protein [Jatrophihabitantaceae bacterium]